MKENLKAAKNIEPGTKRFPAGLKPNITRPQRTEVQMTNLQGMNGLHIRRQNGESNPTDFLLKDFFLFE